MHSFSTADRHLPTYGAMALIAFATAWLVETVLDSVPWPGWLLGSLSFFTIFAALDRLFEKRGWSVPFFGVLGLSTTPDIRGRYEGLLTSSYEDCDGKPMLMPIRLEIHQTWRQISVQMEVSSQSSSSRSVAATLQPLPKGAELRYYYRNEPRPGKAAEDMNDHDGAATIEWRSDGSAIGRYFTMRGTTGTIELDPQT